MSTETGDSPKRPLVPQRLLRSRFGRRLLLRFAACAIVPTCAVAWLSFHSVAGQLTSQSQERLAAVAGAAGRTLFGRIDLVEEDLRKAAARGPGCEECGAALLYAAEEVLELSPRSAPRQLAGESDAVVLRASELPTIAPGRSAVFTRKLEGQPLRVYLAHRLPAGLAASHLVARLSPTYLWSDSDEEALPSSVNLSLWDARAGLVLGLESAAPRFTPELGRMLAGSSHGAFEYASGEGDWLGTWWAPPPTARYHVPGWRVILGESKSDVLAPMADFQRTFPILLAGALCAVVLLCAIQIRKSLQPLSELHQGTARIAAHEFEHQVKVESGDELQDLAGAFNAMSTRLARQFHALRAASEIDRAVLSSVDASSIAETVVQRVPELCPCNGLSVTLLDPKGGRGATTWSAGARRDGQRRWDSELSDEDAQRSRAFPERTVLAPRELPGYLRHLAGEAEESVEVFPLRYSGELLGIVGLRRAQGETSDDDLVQVRRIGDQVAVALSNARMVDQVRFLAFYDSLTRLPNRVLYKERLAQSLIRAGRSGKYVAVCFIDLDHFSRINDTLGHDLGDQLLKEVSARLVGSSRPGDSVARIGDEGQAEVSRLGGDEFTVVLSDLGDPQEAVRVTRRLLEALRKPVRLGTQEVFVTASVGVAIYPFDGQGTEELLKSADVAMYHAKEQGRNTYQLYSSSMNAEAMARLQLEHQLRKAVEAGEFTIWYQPIVDLETRRPVGAEALVRWAHPERGLVSPAEFIALCEECGLIVPLGEWILRGVCTQAAAWDAAGLGTLRMSVNLSARQLRHEGIVDSVRAILEETKLRPRTLVLELTESMLMEPKGVTGRTIRELADLGVSLAIDDFGTGYSSLSYLKNFPVTTLKIDRSFIAGTTTDPDDAAITTAIIALAGAMELDVVAEGVETEAQAEFLKERGCHRIQGYLVGRPVPAEEFEKGLRMAERERQLKAAELVAAPRRR